MSLFIGLIKSCNRCPCWSWNSVISQSSTSSGSSSRWKFHFGFWSFWFSTVTTKLKMSKISCSRHPMTFFEKISRLYLNSLIRDLDRSRRSFQAAMDASSSWLSMWNFNARSDRNDFEHFRQSYSPISEFCLILLRHSFLQIWNSSLASSFDQILVSMVSFIFGWLNYAGRMVQGMMC